MPKTKNRNKKPKLATITACMMVKDGGTLFVQALESLNGFIDELVVVNTDEQASTPDTAAVEAFCERVSIPYKLLHMPWQDDFSLHRNQSLEPATMDWVLIIDADERLVMPEHASIQQFKQWLAGQKPEVHCICIELTDIQQGLVKNRNNSARIFRRGKVKYTGIVHNQPAFNGPMVAVDAPRIEHFGYDLPPEKKQAKFERSYSLLLKTLESKAENPDTFFYLCHLCGQHAKVKESIKWGTKYLEYWAKIRHEHNGATVHDGHMFNPTIYYTMHGRYKAIGDQEARFHMIKTGLENKPGDLDLSAALSEFGAETNNHDMIVKGSSMYLKAYSAIAADPAAKGGHFVFNFSEERLVLEMTRLVCSQMGLAMMVLPALKAMMGKYPYLKDLVHRNFEQMGLTSLIREPEPVGEPNPVEKYNQEFRAQETDIGWSL
jgi:hypothetical protein